MVHQRYRESVFVSFLQAFRTCGGKTTGESPASAFVMSDYNAIIEEWGGYSTHFEHGEIDDIPDLNNPCHYDSLNTYKYVLNNLWSDQAAQGANSLTRELIALYT